MLSEILPLHASSPNLSDRPTHSSGDKKQPLAFDAGTLSFEATFAGGQVHEELKPLSPPQFEPVDDDASLTEQMESESVTSPVVIEDNREEIALPGQASEENSSCRPAEAAGRSRLPADVPRANPSSAAKLHSGAEQSPIPSHEPAGNASLAPRRTFSSVDSIGVPGGEADNKVAKTTLEHSSPSPLETQASPQKPGNFGDPFTAVFGAPLGSRASLDLLTAPAVPEAVPGLPRLDHFAPAQPVGAAFNVPAQSDPHSHKPSHVSAAVTLPGSQAAQQEHITPPAKIRSLTAIPSLAIPDPTKISVAAPQAQLGKSLPPAHRVALERLSVSEATLLEPEGVLQSGANERSQHAFQSHRTASSVMPPLTSAREALEALSVSTQKQIEIQLHPKELGRLRMAMVPGEGQITVLVSAERPEVLEGLRRHIDLLADDLRSFGFGEASFEFSHERGQHTADTEGDLFELRGGEAPNTVTDTNTVRRWQLPDARLDIRL